MTSAGWGACLKWPTCCCVILNKWHWHFQPTPIHHPPQLTQPLCRIRGAVLASILGHHDLRPHAEMVELVTRREAHATRQMIKAMGNKMAEQRKIKLKKQVDEGKQRTCTGAKKRSACKGKCSMWSVVVNAKEKFQCGRCWSMQKE